MSLLLHQAFIKNLHLVFCVIFVQTTVDSSHVMFECLSIYNWICVSSMFKSFHCLLHLRRQTTATTATHGVVSNMEMSQSPLNLLIKQFPSYLYPDSLPLC